MITNLEKNKVVLDVKGEVIRQLVVIVDETATNYSSVL